jgi:ABC-2 type transport system permease protein
MTTYPARALLGTLSLRSVAAGIVAAVVFLAVSRLVWVRSVARYTSASS